LKKWDLPLWAHEAGSWENGQIVDWFAEFVQVVVDALSDQVKFSGAI
jgi:beta-glucosidase